MNLKKKIFALMMVCVSAVGMAPSAFADNVMTNKACHIQNISITDTDHKYLNLEGEGQAYMNRNVTVYRKTSSNDQKWYIENRGNGLKVYTAQTSTTGENYALNVNRVNYNCNIYPDRASNNGDSVVTTKGNQQSFDIDLASTPGYQLQVAGRNVGWGGVSIHRWALK